jgi:hypothetical protein
LLRGLSTTHKRGLRSQQKEAAESAHDSGRRPPTIKKQAKKHTRESFEIRKANEEHRAAKKSNGSYLVSTAGFFKEIALRQEARERKRRVEGGDGVEEGDKNRQM